MLLTPAKYTTVPCYCFNATARSRAIFPGSTLRIDAAGIVGADEPFNALIKLARPPWLPQQWARGRVVWVLFPWIPSYVEDLEVGAHLPRATRQLPPVDARHADVGD